MIEAAEQSVSQIDGDMARRTGSESNTIQAQEMISVGFNLPAVGGETIYRVCFSAITFASSVRLG